jgi:uncharacterized protein (TIGR02145 family)
MLIISISAYGQKIPKVSFYLTNGDVKQYSISDINDIKFQAFKSKYMMKIFYNDTTSKKFNIRSIESIVFEKDKNGIEYLNILDAGRLLIFNLAHIDSINFFLPKYNTPEILDINPLSARIGDEVTINGFNFGDVKDKSILSFIGKDAVEFNNWSDTLIKVIVPKGAQSGSLSVTVNGIKSNDINISIIPFISQIYPKSAGITEYISVYGSGFGNVKSGEFSFNNDKAIEYPQWTDSYLSVTVPKGARSGMAFLTVNGIKSNEFNFNVIQHIISIQPDSAQVGDLVVLKGTKFGSKQGNGLVYFSSTPVIEYKIWSDTEISLIVPDKARSGRVKANINDLSSNNVQFYLIPYISYLMLDSARLNSTVLITGTGFGDFQNNGEVSFNGVKAEIYTGWSCKSIAVKVPTAAKSGIVSVTIEDIKSNEAAFTVLPSIISISPTAANIGDEIAIKGVSFTDTKGSNFVSFGSIKATEYTNWSDTLIKVKVPVGTTTGSMLATIGSNTTNAVLFTIKPKISSISPTSGLVGHFITISGSDFGSERDSGYVTFSNANAIVYTSWSDTLIVVKVPAGASTGKVSVFANKLKSNGVDFICTGGNYEEIRIGTQVWMLKNLDVSTYRNGDLIAEVPLISEWCNLTTGAWCYHDNSPVIGQVYGKLYNWYAVTDPRGLAPDGWHIPSDQEMIALCLYLGGDDVAGGKLKETGTAHWQRPNTGATNESGFTGLPGSYRSFFQWSVLEAEGFMWTTTEFSSARAWYWSLAYDSPTFFRNNQPKFHGLSVRCIKD